ncbi:MAG: T9SS type A sorting domain-containing protein [Cyclobacteriaceae bacterium]|nr:T9SS type A sorting domain-containing protein [Cyclobacteriaceae bacterium]
MKNLLLVSTLIAAFFSVHSQQMISITPKKPIVCYLEAKDKHTFIGPPKVFLKAKNNPGARTTTAVFEVQYIGFDAQSKAAFQHAVDIWSTLIESPVKIKIRAFWRPLGASVLGSAIWANAYANFPNAQKLNTFYPVALAEKIAGKDLNHPDSVDIFANFSSETAWYYETSGTPPSQTTDLVSVVLHEIGHGLGFVDSYDVTSGQGEVGVQGSGIPIIYDLSIENSTNQNLFQSFTSPSSALNTQLISSNLFYNSPLATAQNGARPRVYAPTTWSGGSSIAHLNENTYPSGNINSLMTPQIGFTEVMHDPGPITMNIFSDMGWVGTRMEHTSSNKESFGITTLTTKISSDNGYDASKVKLKFIKKSGGAETEVAGVATGNANEFSFSIPASASIDTLFYLISSIDNIGREFTNPGKFARPKDTDLQGRFTIGLGPDSKAPVIVHTPKTFIAESAISLKLDAVVSDNIGIQDVFVDYSINNITKPALPMTQIGAISITNNSLLATYSSSYTTTINFNLGDIKAGDIVTYKIRAKDNSAGQNVGFSPSSTTSHSVNVVGLASTQDSYQNNFDNLVSTDFFGDPQFTVSKPSGFDNGAIHTVHPYPEAGSGPNLNFIYQLRIPIKVKAQDATIKFDEIVLVEPGTSNDFTNPDFFDYVVVEGSKNGGTTWAPIANGYDSRDNGDWLTKYNSSIVSNISKGVGDPTLYRPRVLNLLNKFVAGDEVVIRFRLFCDAGAAGWGWAIDNLKIQIDDIPPTLLHNHVDYKIGSSTPLSLTVSANDGSGLKSLTIEYKVNNGSIVVVPITLANGVSLYTLDLGISLLSVGDVIEYRIRSSDNIDNEILLPATDFFKVPIISLGTAVNQYVSDFNSTNADFVGNFFSISTPAGFSDGAMNTSHPYPNGFGLTGPSSYSYTLKKPITVSASNPNIVFNEVVIAESALNTDYVVVEGSKDNGISWEAIFDKYSSNAFPDWQNSFNTKQNGIPSLYKLRLFDITKSGKFKAGDNILIRFRLNANATVNAWGWAIDNLSIQGPITGIEKPLIENSFSVYPNPTSGSRVMVKFNTIDDSPVQVQLLSARGDVQESVTVQPISKTVEREFFVGDWSNGLYIVKAEVSGSVITRKFVKTQ